MQKSDFQLLSAYYSIAITNKSLNKLLPNSDKSPCTIDLLSCMFIEINKGGYTD